MRVIVTGDRYWEDKEIIEEELSKLPKDTTIIQGECSFGGVDRFAKEIAFDLGFDVIGYYSNWIKNKESADFIRNRKMLNEDPDLVLAFHNNIKKSRGTKDCIEQAKQRGISVKIIRGE